MKYYNRTFVSFKGNNFFVLHLHNLHYSTCYYGYYFLNIFFHFGAQCMSAQRGISIDRGEKTMEMFL